MNEYEQASPVEIIDSNGEVIYVEQVSDGANNASSSTANTQQQYTQDTTDYSQPKEQAELKERILKNIIEAIHLSDDMGIEPEAMQPFINILSTELNKYTFAPICTAIVVRDSKFDTLLKLYCGTIRTEGKSEKTVIGYSRLLTRFIKEVNKRIEDIGVFDIRAWLAGYQTKVSLTTCENYRAYLSSFFTWCYKEHFLPENPMLDIKPIKLPVQKKERFSDVEIDKLRKACGDNLRDRAMVEVLLSSGVRVEEFCNLNIKDVNMDTKEINIRHGKGNKQRYTFINDVCREHLRNYLNSRDDDDRSLFVSRGGKRMTPATVRNDLHRLAKSAGLFPEDVHPHKFRRTFASKKAQEGINIMVLKELLGHTDLNVTKRYISMDRSQMKNEYERLGG